jgi:gliding motility-associated-like protein
MKRLLFFILKDWVYKVLIVFLFIIMLSKIKTQIVNNTQTIQLCENNVIRTYTIQELAGYDYYFEFIPEPEIITQQDNVIVVKWNNIGTYTLVGKYTSDFCDSRDTKIIINVIDCKTTSFYVPSAFTPNGDGINDIFQPKGTNILQYNLMVYNRWGELIFETNEMIINGGEVYLKGWDGYYKNLIVQDDIYTYVIIYKGIDLKINYLRGKITILK